MGTQIYITDGPETARPEPCLCAQRAPNYADALFDGLEPHRTELAQHAEHDCRLCQGSGVEIRTSPEHMVDLSSRNALAVLGGLMGLDPQDGRISIPEARRALMRARARDPQPHTSPARRLYGAPRTHEDGVVELRPVRLVDQGIDTDGLTSRLDRIAQLVETAAQLGCPGIEWG